MGDRWRGRPNFLVSVVRERMGILFSLARKTGSKQRAKRYVELARKLGRKYNVRMTKEQKLLFCKFCGTLWRIGKNMNVRARNRMVEYICKECGAVKRVPYNKK